jgi:hypothetical protein
MLEKMILYGACKMQLRDIRCDLPGVVFGEQLGPRTPAELSLKYFESCLKGRAEISKTGPRNNPRPCRSTNEVIYAL